MKSTSVLQACFVSGLMLAGSAYAGEISLFSGPHFRGNDMTLHSSSSNLERTGFNDRSESVVVRSGRWEVCSDSDYRGYCTVLEPGEYSLLNGPLFRRISSAREIGPVAFDDRRYYRYGAYDRAVPAYPAIVDRVPAYPAVVDRVPAYPAVEDRVRYGAVELYTQPLFRGYPMRVNNAGALDFNSADGVSSLVVNEGVWELCSGPTYNGNCRVYEPGRYPRLGSFEGSRVSSLRRIG